LAEIESFLRAVALLDNNNLLKEIEEICSMQLTNMLKAFDAGFVIL